MMDWGEGAGFINDSISEEPQQQVQSVQMGGDDKNKLLAAVSVSQLVKLMRPNEGLMLHGKKIYHINMVACVYEIVDINPTKIQVMVHDYSGGGPIEVSHIIGDSGDVTKDPSMSMFEDHMAASGENGAEKDRDIHSMRTGDFIRVVGVPRYNNDKCHVVAYHLRIVSDPNEPIMHMLETIRDSLFYQKLQASGGVMPSTAGKDDKPQGQAQSYQHQSNPSDFGQLSTRDKHLITFLKNKAGEEGLHIDEICKNFTAFKRDEILESLSMLCNEGLCWQGDDENVWCVGA